MKISRRKQITFVLMLSAISTYLMAPYLIGSKQKIPLDYIVSARETVSLSESKQQINLRGLRLFRDQPLKFELLFDNELSSLSEKKRMDLVNRVSKQFISAITAKDQDLWVNLSPYEQDRIIDDKLGQTEYGKDLLSQDYMLKQVSSSLTDPKTELGKKYWMIKDKQKDNDKLSKIWIVPDKAILLADDDMAVIEQSTMKIKYDNDQQALDSIKAAIETGLNKSKEFEHLRQIYNITLLASWYKAKVRSSLDHQILVERNKFTDVKHGKPKLKTDIFNLYLDSFKDGTYSRSLKLSSKSPKRNYFSGGINWKNISSAITVKNLENKKTSSSLHAFLLEIKADQVQNKEQRLSNNANNVLEKIVSLLGSDQETSLKAWQEELELYQILNKDFIREDYLVQAMQSKLKKAQERGASREDISYLENETLRLRTRALKKRAQSTDKLIKSGIISYLENGELAYESTVFQQIKQSPFMELFNVILQNGGWKTLHELAHKSKFSTQLRRSIHYARRQFIISVLREAYMRVHKTETAPSDNNFVGIFGSDNWIFSDLDISAKGASGNKIICEYYSIMDELFGAEIFTEDLFDSNIYAGFLGLNKIIINGETIAQHKEILAQAEEVAAFTSILMSVDKIHKDSSVTKAFGSLLWKMHQAPNNELFEYYYPLIEKASINYMQQASIIKKANEDKQYRRTKHIEYLEKITKLFQDNNIIRDNDGFFYFSSADLFAKYLETVITLKQLEIDAYHTPSAINSTVNNKQIARNNVSNSNYNDFGGKLNYQEGILVAALEHMGKVIERANPVADTHESKTETFLHVLKYFDRIVQEAEALDLNISKTGFLFFPKSVKASVRAVSELDEQLGRTKSVYFSRRLDKADLFIDIEYRTGFSSQNEDFAAIRNDIAFQILKDSIENELADIANLSRDKSFKFIESLGSFERFINKACELLSATNAKLLKNSISDNLNSSFKSLSKIAKNLAKDESIKHFERLRILKAIRRTLTSNHLSRHRRENDGDQFRIDIVNKQLVSVANSVVFNIMVELYARDKGSYNVPKLDSSDRRFFASFEAEADNSLGGIDFSNISKNSFHQKIRPIIFNSESYKYDELFNSNNFSFKISSSIDD